MRYVIRSVKYLLLLGVLLVAMSWLSTLGYPAEAEIEFLPYLIAQYTSERGVWMLVGVVALAALYPLFGFVKMEVEGCSMERDSIRIDNAMQRYGFTLVDDGADRRVYRAEGMLHRLTLMYEDRVEVRATERGVELSGLRRPTVRIAYLLRSYMENSRFER